MEQDKSPSELEEDSFGFTVARETVEIGKTYPIFGMITALRNERPGEIVAEINHSITAKMSISSDDRLETLKERAFEMGIFVATVVATEPTIEVECSTVIFGRKQAHYA
ncbi:MAG: hypothetical protein KDD69_04480 [Bdellovibrionales bacterium]|nr:hypothetical protein [Bdellovibrionales bacterium]